MIRRPPRSTRTDTLFPDTTLFRSICLFGKTHDYHAEVALGVSLDENVGMIADSIAEVVRRGREAIFDCEHFFDGWKANPDYALRCAKAAYDAGARWVVLCDTNGGALPDEIERIVARVVETIPGDRLGIHTHNDTRSEEHTSELQSLMRI